MFIYHGVWFAVDADLLDLDLRQLHWVVFQKCIAGSFFGLVGISLQLATTPAFRPRPFLQRLGKLLVCAGVVTVTSIVLNPSHVVTFGILHSIAACSVLALPFRRAPSVLTVPFAAGLILLGALYTHERFNAPALSWLGMAASPTPTFDHQPLLPWLGVVLLGGVLGRWIATRPPPSQPLSPRLSPLGRMGRHSLLLYMGHVPVLMFTMMALQWWLTGG